MTMQVDGTNGWTFADGSTQKSAGYVPLRNRVYNGDMRIDQRNAGASVTPADGAYTLDRWYSRQTVASKYSVQQSTTAPTGFVNSMLVTSLSAYSVGSGDVFTQSQQIEGFNAADLGWGAAGAATVTLSFWVRSSLTGTFGGSLANSAADRSYPFTYTISAANTWEQKSVTIAGDTSGTWLKNNGIGIRVWFGLGVGSNYSGTAGSWAGADYRSATGATSVVGTNGATFYITGVQLEKGSVATPFEVRPYGTELALCQRYYYQSLSTSDVGMQIYCVSGNNYQQRGNFIVPMRASPTVGLTGSAVSSFNTPTMGANSANSWYISGAANATANNGYFFAGYTATAEL